MSLPDFTVYSQLPTGAYMKKSDRSGPYAWDGSSMVLTGFLDSSDNGEAATLTVTTGLVGNSGAKFDLYNTADKTTNYERLRADWSGNVASLFMTRGGTGVDREFRIGNAAVAYMRINPSASFLRLGNGGGNLATATVFSNLGEWGATASSGTQTITAISPTFNQSGTAGYTAFDINPTETATGSGTKLLQRWAVGGTAVGQLYNNGVFYSGFVIGANRLGLSSTIGGTADIELNRDAADTLALRRSTNAQTFRVYNTYTDASNYERGTIGWAGSNFQIGTQSAGTGSVRNMRFMAGGTERWEINASTGSGFPVATDTYDWGIANARIRSVFSRQLMIADGITAPSATANYGTIYIDSADGDLKIVFGDGTVKTIVTDT